MKRVVCLLTCFAFCIVSFSQAESAYKQYLKTLCNYFQKDTAGLASMTDASDLLGRSMNLVDTTLRNKAMKEKGLLKADDENLQQFEKLFAMDLVINCASFQSIIEKLSNQASKKVIARKPVLDTIAQSVCGCLERKGVSNVKSVVVGNITDCLNSSIVKHYDEMIEQYQITDENQDVLSSLGDEISKMVMKECTFYLQKLNPVLQQK